jgi:hypothetical protein
MSHFYRFSDLLHCLIDAGFNAVAYKDSQCLRGFQEKSNFFSFFFRSTTRVIPTKLKIIEKIF